MSMSNDPFAQPSTQPEPGLGKPVAVLVAIFVMGLVTIGLIYLAGTPAEPETVAGESTPAMALKPPADTPKPEPTQAPSAPTGEAYVAANGESPLPKHGEAEAPPIAAKRLITQEAYDAAPPEASTLPAPEGPVPWTEAHQYLGQTITVKGTVVDTNNIGQICFLNYDADWQDKFYVAMFKEAFELLPDPPETHYLNKTLLVTGKVSLHRDRPQIQVHDVSQIEVVE